MVPPIDPVPDPIRKTRCPASKPSRELVPSLPFRQQRRQFHRDLFSRNPLHALIAPNDHRIPISAVLGERLAYSLPHLEKNPVDVADPLCG